MSVEIHDAILIYPVAGVVVGDLPQPQQQQQQQQPQPERDARPQVQVQVQERPRRRAPAPPQRGRVRSNTDYNANNNDRGNREIQPPPGVPPIEPRPGFENRGRPRGFKLENSNLQGIWESTTSKPNEEKTEIYQSGNELVVVNDSKAWSPSVGKIHSDFTITFHDGGLLPLKAVLDMGTQSIHFCNGATWRRVNQKKQPEGKKRRKCQKGCAMQ
eukprot:TRINITY_DN172_c3_g1_i2.p1 TRINITY_DN172_c3_g1~~TRINITY_DN172_c3_g1_i2.p1  ORF type:complete len:215 (+),score=43.68 TRINITY_DN172_c3_g1_i2:43-687(+)